MPRTSQTRNSGRDVATAEVLATEGISQKQTYHQHHRQEPAAEMIATAEGVGNRRDITKTDIP